MKFIYIAGLLGLTLAGRAGPPGGNTNTVRGDDN
jgi:hypothetical protein